MSLTQNMETTVGRVVFIEGLPIFKVFFLFEDLSDSCARWAKVTFPTITMELSSGFTQDEINILKEYASIHSQDFEKAAWKEGFLFTILPFSKE